MKTHRARTVLYFLLLAGQMSWAQTISVRQTESHTSRPTTELYSESYYLPTYGLLSDSRVPYYFLKKSILQSYAGAAIQRQDVDTGKPNLYTNSVSPLIGLKMNWLKQVSSFLEYRELIVRQAGKTVYKSDPRLVVYAGDILSIKQPLFVEYYGEVVAIPRVSSSLVSTVWGKVGLRNKVAGSLNVDSFGELFARRTPDTNFRRGSH